MIWLKRKLTVTGTRVNESNGCLKYRQVSAGKASSLVDVKVVVVLALLVRVL